MCGAGARVAPARTRSLLVEVDEGGIGRKVDDVDLVVLVRDRLGGLGDLGLREGLLFRVARATIRDPGSRGRARPLRLAELVAGHALEELAPEVVAPVVGNLERRFLLAELARRSEAAVARRGLREREEVRVPLHVHNVLSLVRVPALLEVPPRRVALAVEVTRRELPLLSPELVGAALEVAMVVRAADDAGQAERNRAIVRLSGRRQRALVEGHGGEGGKYRKPERIRSDAESS